MCTCISNIFSLLAVGLTCQRLGALTTMRKSDFHTSAKDDANVFAVVPHGDPPHAAIFVVGKLKILASVVVDALARVKASVFWHTRLSFRL